MHQDSQLPLPSYDELPPAPLGGRSGWGIFGETDSVGLLNLQTSERVVKAAQLIRRGALFPLDAPINAFDPSLVRSRSAPRRHLLHQPGAITYDDVYDNFYPQASSQWDALSHCGYASNQFYNGATEDDIAAGRRDTIDFWARRGIAGRAIMLDMLRAFSEQGRSFEPGSSFGFTVDDLEGARKRARVNYQVGDILILHTGFAAWYNGLNLAERMHFADKRATVGLQADEAMCSYLWNAHVCAVASDTFAVESTPTHYDRPPPEFLHRVLIGLFGMALGELWWTDDLASDCASDGVNEFFLTSMPMNAPGGVGSPPHALAIK